MLEQQLAEAHAAILEQSKAIADLGRQAGESARRIAEAPRAVREAIPGDGVALSPWERARAMRGGQQRQAPVDVESRFEPAPMAPAAAPPEAAESLT